jgi:bifunctional enzyme CysN/CysC
MNIKSSNLVTVKHRITVEERWKANKHKGGIMWFTGLPGSGKSTLAIELESQLFQEGTQVYVLDGDNIRQGLSSDLGFSPTDRTENIRRIGEVGTLFADAGFIVIAAFISPYRKDRELARQVAGDFFNEIYIKADVTTCEKRDPKGHYQLARTGKIPEFTGVSAPYEEPNNPDLIVDTNNHSVDQCKERLINFIGTRFTH